MGTGHGDGLIKAVAKAKKIVNVLPTILTDWERKIPTRFQGLRHRQSVAENIPPLGIEYPGLDYLGQEQFH